jgi:hypothetical protein
MAGCQFYHFEGYSRTESQSKSKKGKSIYTVAGECERTPGYCDHVENPIKPLLLHGIPFSAVTKLAEEYAEKTLDRQGKKVRKNGLIMIAGVISAPPDMSPEIWEIYKKECLKWLTKVWGPNLKSVMEHFDECFEADPDKGIKPGIVHRHIHFACVAPVGMKFSAFHPGLKAKRAADSAYGITKKPEGMTDEEFKIFKKEGRIAGDHAYKAAMSKEQDSFYAGVGETFGLMRYGPKRLRLSREEIIKRDHEKRLKQKRLLEVSEQEKKALEIAENIQQAESELASIKTHITNLNNEAKILDEREKTIKKREREQTEYEKGLKTNLGEWVLPEPEKHGMATESAKTYRQRILPKVMGIIKRAMDVAKEYTAKKWELEKKQRELEKGKLDAERDAGEKIRQSDSLHVVIVKNLKEKYNKLMNRIISVKTLSDVEKLKHELIRDINHQRSR